MNRPRQKTGRVITGSAKSIPIIIPPKSRAITDRAKMSLFSMIGPDLINKTILDLFAGSGSLGIEAISRGAKHAFFIDQDKSIIQTIRSNLEKTRLSAKSTVRRQDVFQFLTDQAKTDQKYDIVFADPPFPYYDQHPTPIKHLITKILPIIPEAGAIIMKHPSKISPPKKIEKCIFGFARKFGESSISLWVKKTK